MVFRRWFFLGNSPQAWAYALLIAAGMLAAAWIARQVLVRHFSALTRKTKTDVDDLIARLLLQTRWWLLAAVSLYVGSLSLTLSATVRAWARTAALIALLIQAAIWGDEIISYWLVSYQKRHAGDGEQAGAVKAAGFVVRLALFSIIALLALDNLPGVEVGTLIASLGIGGIAVALAVQNILADLLASLSIALDQPFVVGDYIAVDDLGGTVEHIGLKTTRLRSLAGEQLILANNDLLSSRIRNYKRMDQRRIASTLGVACETSYEKVERIPAMIREIVEAQPQTRFDRCHFKAFGDFTLDFETVYYMLDPGYGLYMDTQQAINLAILKRFAEEGIELAYPTQLIYVSGGQASGVPGTQP
jgi:small-conductance mechanosensitive channel